MTERQHCEDVVDEMRLSKGGELSREDVVDLLITQRQRAIRGVFYMVGGMKGATELALGCLSQTNDELSEDGSSGPVGSASTLLGHVLEGMKQMEQLTRTLSDLPNEPPPPFAELIGLVERCRITLWSVAYAYERVGEVCPQHINRAIAALGERELDVSAHAAIWGDVIADRYMNDPERKR